MTETARQIEARFQTTLACDPTYLGTLTDAAGVTRWRCHACRRRGVWEPGWGWYGSLRDMDEGGFSRGEIPVWCSSGCRSDLIAAGAVPAGAVPAGADWIS